MELKRIKKKEVKKRVTLRLEPSLVNALHALAEKKGMKYQAMVREWLKKAVRSGGM